MVKLPRFRVPQLDSVELPLVSSVRGRIIGGFGLLIIILIVVVAGSVWLWREHRSALVQMEATAATVATLEDARFNVTLAALLLERYLVTGSERVVPVIGASMATVEDELAEAHAQEESRGDQEVKGVDDEAEIERLNELVAEADALSDTFEQVIALRQRGDAEGARQFLEAAAPDIRMFGLLIGEAVQEEGDEIPPLKSRADRTAELAFWLLILSGGAGAALGLAASVLIARSILKPLSSVESVALAVAGGDLEARAEPTGPRELARLGASLNRMTESLLGLNQSLEEKVGELEEEVAERKRGEETIRHLAYHDVLTGLPNRALLKDRLGVALAHARRNDLMLAVMFLDLDRFKLVNDTAGHVAGDELLRDAGRQLKELVREGDTVGRVGGDEFVLILPELARVDDATEVAQRVIESFRRPQTLAGHEFHITSSIGITIFPTDGDSPEALLTNADIAMYHAKEQGRDNYQFYTADLNARILERVALENDLRHGLEREEFVVYYQPQVNIKSGQIVGMEALLRWQHPDRGLVMPMEFIPAADETGLIVPLGEWVLRTACAQTKAWQDAGLSSLRIAVNLSTRQFQERDLAERVAQVLEETGLDPHRLQLEITESAAIQDVDYTAKTLQHLKEMGVQIAIDDFGTGHSALSYLRRFPIDVVKIDRSFIRDLTTNPGDAELANTVIVMAHNLQLQVIAEGVETEEQLAFLKERSCDEMQGYLFSRPVPATELEALLAKHKRSEAA